MKTLVKYILAGVLSVGFLLCPGREDVHAQIPVTDAASIAERATQFGQQVLQWFEENQNAWEGLMHQEKQTAWLDQICGEGAVKKLTEYIRNSEEMLYMVESVNSTLESYSTYLKYIGENMGDLDPSVTAQMMRRTGYLVDNVSRSYKRAQEILGDKSLDYYQKKQQLAQEAAAAAAAADRLKRETASVFDSVNETRSMTASMLALSGAATPENIRKAMSFYGTYGMSPGAKDYKAFFGDGSGELVEVKEGTISASDVLESSDLSKLRSGYSNVFYLISILLALLMAGLSVTVLIKWNRGEYGAGDYGERGWFSIMIAIIVASFILSILSAYVGTKL